MAWTNDYGNKYKLIQLDTNVLSGILKSDATRKIFFEKFGPSEYIICFTIYNVIEIRRRMDLYKSFLDFFSLYPAFLLKTHNQILVDEVINRKVNIESVLQNAFSVLGDNESYSIQKFFNSFFENTDIKSLEKSWKREEKEIQDSWLISKRNFKVKSESPNLQEAEKYVKDSGIQFLMNQFPKWAKSEVKKRRDFEIDRFPSLKIMLYSQYFGLFDENRQLSLTDVTDVRIMASVPYMDATITENFQAEVFRKVKRVWDRIGNLEVYTLKDLRE